MPFDRPIPHPLNTRCVSLFAPSQSGLYGISSQDEWVYIGEADDIRNALLQFLEGNDSREKAKADMTRLGFVFELCSRGLRPGRQDQLVREYEPKRNRRLF